MGTRRFLNSFVFISEIKALCRLPAETHTSRGYTSNRPEQPACSSASFHTFLRILYNVLCKRDDRVFRIGILQVRDLDFVAFRYLHRVVQDGAILKAAACVCFRRLLSLSIWPLHREKITSSWVTSTDPVMHRLPSAGSDLPVHRWLTRAA